MLYGGNKSFLNIKFPTLNVLLLIFVLQDGLLFHVSMWAFVLKRDFEFQEGLSIWYSGGTEKKFSNCYIEKITSYVTS